MRLAILGTILDLDFTIICFAFPLFFQLKMVVIGYIQLFGVPHRVILSLLVSLTSQSQPKKAASPPRWRSTKTPPTNILTARVKWC